MSSTFAAMIEAANRALLIAREDASVEEYFAPEFVAHGTQRDLTGGPAAVRRFLAMLHDVFSDWASCHRSTHRLARHDRKPDRRREVRRGLGRHRPRGTTSPRP
jgi:hypothetical protein